MDDAGAPGVRARAHLCLAATAASLRLASGFAAASHVAWPEGAPQDYQPIISIGAHELAAPFESETSEQVHVRLDQLATQLRDAGMDKQKIELATII